ncbi:MAG: CpaF/VirB11 family protein [Bacilli bacterium]|nr:CpaF/VirB11 family protein [Bacilli bacterium]
MEANKISEFVSSSFLSPILSMENVTDISYNGESIFYEDSLRGRNKYQRTISKETVGDFLRQIANMAEKQFSYQSPILDVSFSGFRLNAVFLSLARINDEKSYSFTLRIAQRGSKVKRGSSFFGEKAEKILLDALKKRASIVISGPTSSGKTELQKFLMMNMPESMRVICIDNVEELEMVRGDTEIDLTSWLVDERYPDSSFGALIRNALRSNPDYIIVAESRGKEMLDALNSVMSGHPIIMTLHSKDLLSIPHRMARMAMMGEQKLIYEDVLSDVYHAFSYCVYLVKKEKEDGSIERYIESIGILNEAKMGMDVLYRREEK